MDNNTPPVCNYEGSDYQTRFWDKGGRAYEDAVEAVALQRLLPTSGRLMLELGAGAGRNTPRYSGYEQVVLVDYSRTQLEQAKSRLGDQHKYIYVAADIYRLPFVNQVFDGATMIRTLHHMADAPFALGQVNRVVQPGGTFILEYASKLNLKAILRYALKLQSWSPFDPAPIEFAALNFDFHPDTIRTWLKEAGFQIEKQLTVSHLRFPIFKKLIPLPMLVGLDSLFQYTGDLWQLTPSVFVRSHSTQEQYDTGSTGLFQCPVCGNAQLKENTNVLICMDCGRQWPHENGIYDFRS